MHSRSLIAPYLIRLHTLISLYWRKKKKKAGRNRMVVNFLWIFMSKYTHWFDATAEVILGISLLGD